MWLEGWVGVGVWHAANWQKLLEFPASTTSLGSPAVCLRVGYTTP